MKNKKKAIEKKILSYKYSIKLLDIIINTYEKYKTNYFHNLNIINISQDIDNDEIVDLSYKNKKFEQLLIEYFNEKYRVDLTGEEVNIDLTGKKIGNTGLKMLTKIDIMYQNIH